MDPTTSGSCSLPPIAVKSEPQDSQLSQNYPDDNAAGISRAQSLPNPPVVVKAEPIEPTRPTNSQPSTLQSQFVIPPPPALSIKPEPQSEPLNGTQQTHEVASATVSPVAPDEPTIKIDYTPENALAEGRQMAAEVEAHLVGIDLSTDLRKEVWLREVASCKNFALPQTMIAVRGATGAGKSSLLNAILDDNIVPTSGMQACTAVVTEIRHHETSNIRAEVEFLSRAEWESELEILRDDLVDESGKPKRVADLRSDAGIAWHKASSSAIHAVYPHLRVEQILAMTPQQIIGEDLDIANKFDTTADIDRPNSEGFGVAIAPYIDSKDPKRTRRGRSKKRENAPPKEPALWPLIRIVRVWCKSNAISCGAVLVDLPGTADTNLARSNIAKDYMKKCQCIWIVAPITRAVDDKVAKDLLGEAFKTQLMNGNYQAGNVTFIATKTDDISCNEVLGALGLWREPEFIDIKMRGKAADHEMEERQSAVAAKADEIAENIHQAKILKDMHTEYKEHLKAFRAHQPFKPYLTAPGYQAPQRSPPKKRKRPSGNRKASGKRARIDSEDIHPSDVEHDDMGGPMDIDNGDALFEDPEEFDELDDDMVPGTEDEDEEEQVQEQRRQGPPEHEVIVISDSDEEIVVISSSDGPEAPKSAPVAAPVTPTGPATQASLKRLIAKTFDEMKAMQERKKQLGKELAEAKIWADEPNKLKAKLQMETNAFCSTRRNEYSKDVLKEDFRQGLKQIDQAEAEAKNPETFDPATELRDYSTINLPVFTCSSRDYIRIQSQVKGDGGPSCFTKIEDTEIPALQEWCHKLTTHARERAARSLLEQLSALLEAVLSYVNEVQGANMADRLMLAEAWESSAQQSSIDKGNDLGLTTAKPSAPLEPATPVKPSRVRRKTMTLPPSPPASQKLTAMAQRARDLLEQERYASQQANKSVSFRLRQTLRVVVEDCIGQMKQTFHDVIAERCRAGADKSKMAAIETSDNLAASVPWQTYRAVLRHDGEHRGDLNADLVGPMTREMAPSWAQVFDSESDMFAPLMKAARSELSKLLQQIQTSAPPGLKDRCEDQCLIAFNEAHVTTNAILNNIKDYLTNAQKDISRSLTPHIKKELRNAYAEAAAQAGPGSVARQKQMFHDQIDLIRQNVFSDGANALFHQLEQAAEDIGALLHLAFSELSEKVEVVVSVLWDIPADNKAEMIKRRELAKLTQTMLRQSKAWLEAIENSASQLQMDPVTSTSTDKFGPRGAAGDDEDYESDEDSLMTDANTQEQLYARAPVS